MIPPALPRQRHPVDTVGPVTREPMTKDPSGIIHLGILKSMFETLQDSASPRDNELADWIMKNYFTPPVDSIEDGRGIYTSEAFHHLLEAYIRAQSLSNSTKPSEWPFRTTNWKPMTKTAVRRNAFTLNAAEKPSVATPPHRM